MKKIAIIIGDSNGSYPVPAVRGSAVSILVEHLLRENSKSGDEIFFEVFSFYDRAAEKESRKFKNVKFIWIKVPKIVRLLDNLFFKCFSKLFKNKKTISFKTIFSLITYILSVSKFMRKNTYDKVIIENNVVLAWIIKLSKYKGEYYYHLHNIPRKNIKCDDVFKNCSAYLCVSKFVANEIIKDSNPIGPVPKDKIQILYNCIDTNNFYKIENKEKLTKIKEKYNISENEKVLIFVGRISPEKGLHCIIDAMQYLNDCNVKLIIVGSFLHNVKEKDSYQQLLEQKTKIYQNMIIWTGYVEQDELVNLYNIADIAVLPSIWEEPAGLTMIEALACGLPVITTYSGGIPEYVEKLAILIDKENDISQKLSDVIKKTLNNNSLYTRENIEYRIEMINKQYNSKRYYEDFKKIMRKVEGDI